MQKGCDERIATGISGGFGGAYEQLLPEFERTSIKVTTGSGASQGTGPQTIEAGLAFEPYCRNLVSQFPNYLWMGQLRTAITLLLATLLWPVSAQTAQNVNLNEEISKLRACARARAPEAQAAGVRTSDEAANYFFEACIPVLGLFLMGSDVDLRIAFSEEWNAFMGRTDKP
jgi:hypothetical protein